MDVLIVTAGALVGVFIGYVVVMATSNGTKVWMCSIGFQCPGWEGEERGRRWEEEEEKW